MKRNLALLLSLCAAAGCGRPPRPAVMAETERAQKSPGAELAAELSPEAYAHTEKLRREAESAYQAGDTAGAQILSEHALAAHQHAVVLARIARAGRREQKAQRDLAENQKTLATTEAEQKRIAAEADDLTVRIKVIRDAVPIAPSGPADAAREKARLASARSLALDARLLCAAARLLDPKAEVADREKDLDELDKKLATDPKSAPVDTAMKLRSQCLAAVTAARRPAAASSSLGRSDELLSELSSMGDLTPRRDDRGVVVTLRGLFRGDDIAQDARERLTTLGRVARAHASFPLQVLVHAASPAGTTERTREQTRGANVAKLLVEGGAEEQKIQVHAGGASRPLLDSSVSKTRERNQRVEIIFVDPGG